MTGSWTDPLRKFGLWTILDVVLRLDYSSSSNLIVHGIYYFEFLNAELDVCKKESGHPFTENIEPRNLSALAISLSSFRMSGSYGMVPEGEQMNADWHVKWDNSGHMFI
jgi:hypothetical protein